MITPCQSGHIFLEGEGNNLQFQFWMETFLSPLTYQCFSFRSMHITTIYNEAYMVARIFEGQILITICY